MNCGNCDAVLNKSSDCWSTCRVCGKLLCPECGSYNLGDIEDTSDEAEYWCCIKCNDCGHEGCTGCI